jgi:hypothetical protein
MAEPGIGESFSRAREAGKRWAELLGKWRRLIIAYR